MKKIKKFDSLSGKRVKLSTVDDYGKIKSIFFHVDKSGLSWDILRRKTADLFFRMDKHHMYISSWELIGKQNIFIHSKDDFY